MTLGDAGRWLAAVSLIAVMSGCSTNRGRGGGSGDDDTAGDDDIAGCDGNSWFDDGVPIEDVVYCPEPGTSIGTSDSVFLKNDTGDEAACSWRWTNTGQFVGQFTMAVGEEVEVGPLGDLEVDVCLWDEIPEFSVTCTSSVVLGTASWSYPSGLPQPDDCPALLRITNETERLLHVFFSAPSGQDAAEELVGAGDTIELRADQAAPFTPGAYHWAIWDDDLGPGSGCPMPDAQLSIGTVFEATVTEEDFSCQ